MPSWCRTHLPPLVYSKQQQRQRRRKKTASDLLLVLRMNTSKPRAKLVESFIQTFWPPWWLFQNIWKRKKKLHNLWKICHRSLLKETTCSSLIMWEYFWDEFQTSRKIKYLLYNFWRLLVIFCCTKMTRKVVGKICRYILKLTF